MLRNANKKQRAELWKTPLSTLNVPLYFFVLSSRFTRYCAARPVKRPVAMPLMRRIGRYETMAGVPVTTMATRSYPIL